MRNRFAIALIIAAALGFYRLTYTPSYGVAAPTTAPSTQPVNKMCAVETDDAIDPAVTVVYKGQTIGFCCQSCVKKFNADPEKYMKTLK